ncbi:MAG: DNA mismatch repair protein MutS, partial [Planctomycetota bacterium]
YGIHVAKIAGIPDGVIQRANQLLADLAVSHASATPKPGAASAPAPPPQMSLFTEYVPHPVVEKLQQADLNALTPMQAFDLIRRWQDELDPNRTEKQS